MKCLRFISIALGIGLFASPSGVCFAGGEVEDLPPGVSGVVGLRPVTTQSCIAVWIPIAEGEALSGFSWFNNDGNIVYPEILLESGVANNPVFLDESRVVAENVRGSAFEWSEVELTEPTACHSEGLYILIRFPEGSEYTSDGTGGGAALGYRTDGQGYPGWISADGRDWIAFKGDFGFAIQPQYVSTSDGTVFMKSAQRDPKGNELEAKETVLFGATPNPFNPSTRLRFNIAKKGHVELSIFSLRGELVNRLVDKVYSAGSHEVVWAGRDGNGRGVPSGVYFARMRAGNVVMTQRMVMIQ